MGEQDWPSPRTRYRLLVVSVVLALVLAGSSLWREGEARLIFGIGYAILAVLFALQAWRLRRDMNIR